jgi:hypothetical protein
MTKRKSFAQQLGDAAPGNATEEAAQDERLNEAIDDSGVPSETATASLMTTIAPASPNGKRVETKAQRFRRLRDRRLPAALKQIQRLTTLANKAQYECSDAAREQIFQLVDGAVTALKLAYNGAKATTEAVRFAD